MNEEIKSPKVGTSTEKKSAGNRGKGRKKAFQTKTQHFLKTQYFWLLRKLATLWVMLEWFPTLNFKQPKTPTGL